jgi:hypothetical protein
VARSKTRETGMKTIEGKGRGRKIVRKKSGKEINKEAGKQWYNERMKGKGRKTRRRKSEKLFRTIHH